MKNNQQVDHVVDCMPVRKMISKKEKDFLLMCQCNDYIGYTNLDMDVMI